MLLAADAYLPNVDYAVCYGPASGSVVVNFNAKGSYVMRVARQSGATSTEIVEVGTKALDTCEAVGVLTEFPCPQPPKAYEGADADDPPDFANQCTVTSISNLVDLVCTATEKIDLVLVDHGSEGSISINGERVSCDAGDAANLMNFCRLNGKVKSVTLLSCSTGHGDAGKEFLLKISKKLGAVPVTGYTGRVRSFDRNGKRLWGSFGVPTTQTNAKLAIAPQGRRI